MAKYQNSYTATGASGLPVYKWYFNGDLIAGESGDVLDRPDITDAGGELLSSVTLTDTNGRKRTKYSNKLTILNILPTIDVLTEPALTRGAGQTVNIVVGTYSNGPAVTRTYYLNGVATGGIAPPTYTLGVGDTLYFTEVATKDGYVTATATSNVIAGTAVAPTAFGDTDWYVEDAAEDGSLRFYFGTLPYDGGSPITNIYIYQDGSTTPIVTNVTTPGLFYLVSGLTADQQYSYTAAAVNAIGTGALSNAQTATPILNPPQGVVSDQVAKFGALTAAGAGGFKLVDVAGNLVDITSVTPVSGMGSYVASITSGNADAKLNGRLKFNLAGCPDGAVINCGWSGGTAKVTVSSVPLAYSVASKGEYFNAMTAAHPAGGKTILFRRGDIDMMNASKPTDKNYLDPMTLTCEVAPPARFAEGSLTTRLIGGLSFVSCSNITAVGLDLYEPGGGSVVGYTGPCRKINFYRCEVHCKPLPTDGTLATLSGQASGWVCGSTTGRPQGWSGYIRECLIHDLASVASALSFSQADDVLIEDNECYRFMEDGWKYGCSGDGLLSSKIFRRNVHSWPVKNTSSAHGDVFAQGGGNGGLVVENMQFIQNIAFVGSANADQNGQGCTAFTDGALYRMLFKNLVFVGNAMLVGGSHSVYLAVNGGVVRNNIAAGPNGPATSTARYVGMETEPGISTLPVKLENNIGEGVYAPINAGTDTNNLRTGGGTGAYNAAYAGAASLPATSWEEVKSKYATLDASRGAFGATGLTYGNPRDPASWYCDPALLV